MKRLTGTMNTMRAPYPQYQPRAGKPRGDQPQINGGRPRASFPQMRYPARSRRTISSHQPTWLIILAVMILSGLFITMMLVMGGMYVFALTSGRVMPGVAIGHIAAGSLSEAELAQKIDAEWNRQKTITLSDGKHQWTAAPIELGLWVDPQTTAARAYQIGRGSELVQELLWLARFGKISVKPVVMYNEPGARAGLERLAVQVNQPARNPSLRIVNGQWVVVPGQNGSTLNIEQTLKLIAAQPEQIAANGSLPLVTQVVSPRITDLSSIMNRLQSAIDDPLKLEAYDPIANQTIPIQVPRETFATWVTVEGEGTQISLSLDGQKVSAYLNEWKSQLGAGKTLEAFTLPADLTERWQSGQPVTVLVHYNPTTYTVQPGDTLSRIAYKVGMPYWKIQQANPGISANLLAPGQSLTIPSKNDMLPLPIVLNKRIVVSITQQRMWTYENGALRREYVISTGIERSPTNPGVYQVRTHEINAYASAWDLYMPHFMGIYEGWPGFMNGIHGLPTLSSGQRLWAGYLGRPISYGCIVMGLQDAEDVYNWAEAGTIVEIQP